MPAPVELVPAVSASNTPPKTVPAKRKPAAKKAPAANGKNKAKRPRTSKASTSRAGDETDRMSEAGYTATAASSPGNTMFSGHTPEPEQHAPTPNHHTPMSAPPQIPPPQLPLAEPAEPMGPVPVYPLPTKPFPVMPPPKMGSGFLPVIPLEKTHRKVRHWRVAHRQISGIAGGRWYARAWAGERRSELADTVAKRAGAMSASVSAAHTRAGSQTLALGSRSSTTSASAPVAMQGMSGVPAPPRRAGSSLAPSASASRSSSAIPDGSISATMTRQPSKMRIAQMAPGSERSASSSVPPPDQDTEMLGN